MKGSLAVNSGESNIINSGRIIGDCIAGNKHINININVMNNVLSDKLSEVIDSLHNITKTQSQLSEAILKQKEIDLKDAEARVINARAEENKSLATLNLSKVLLEEGAKSEKLISFLEQYGKK